MKCASESEWDLALLEEELQEPTSFDMAIVQEKDDLQKTGDAFDWATCPAWSALTEHFGDTVTHREMCSVAWLLVSEFEIPKISRDARRSYPALIRWFQENWESVGPILHKITLEDDNMETINRERELQLFMVANMANIPTLANPIRCTYRQRTPPKFKQ
jgi:hypothetical protein